MHRISSLSRDVMDGVDKEEPEGGYDLEFVEDVDDEYKCSICLDVLRDPYQIVPCGHRCCRSCLGTLLRTFKDKASCPIDREQISLAKMFPDNSCRRRIQNLKVKCEHDGCAWVAELANYQTHIAECLYMETSCTNEGCNQKFLKKDKEKHENSNCQWRIIHCGQCMDKVRAFELKEHQAVACPYQNVPCNNGCLFFVPRLQMEAHIREACPNTILECPLGFAGCHFKGRRKDVDKHMTENARGHIECLCREVMSLKLQIEQMSEKKAEIPRESMLIRQQENTPRPTEQAQNEQCFIWEILAFSQIVKFNELRSMVYATGPRGYCFVVALLKREEDSVVSIRLVPGRFDSLLPWPFKCDFSLTLVDQSTTEDRQHIRKVVDFSDFGPNDRLPQCYERPVSDAETTMFPLLVILNETFEHERYSPNDLPLIMIKMKCYNFEQNLGI